MRYRYLICSLFFLHIFCSVSVVWSIERSRIEEKHYPMPSGGRIVLTADDGDIEISSWEREEVYLKITKRTWGENSREADQILENMEIEIREEKDGLVIREMDTRETENQFHLLDLFDPNFWRDRGRSGGVVDFELTVPEHIHLRLRCDEGNVNVSRIQGEIYIEVDEGDVDLKDIVTPQMIVGVDEGDVDVRKIESQDRGMINIETDEGSILIEEGQIGEADIGADEGDIIFRNVVVERFWFGTDEGDIEVDFHPMKNGKYRLEADEGDVEISLRDDADLQVVLQTNEGWIDSDFDLDVRRRDEAERAEGTIGQGEGTLRVYTEEGDIRLLKNH